MPSPITHMGLGLILGLRHAFEADHIAAIAAIVSRERNPFGLFYGATTLAEALARHRLS